MRWFTAIFFVPFVLVIGLSVHAQDMLVEEVVPEDAGIINTLLRDMKDATMKFAPGVYNMDAQIRFNANTNLTLEGSGSGFGPDATVLDFLTYSLNPNGDGRAISLRGGAVFRNLTIVNALDRAVDVRTGTVDAPSNATVIFENVWFVDCNLGLKSTGGRTAGTAENPVQVRHCVFAITSDYPFESVNDAVDVRDTTYIEMDHCDFFNHPNIVDMSVNDPEAAPNIGPQVTIRNSIILAADGTENDDLNVEDGNLTLIDSVVWDLGNDGDIQRTGDGISEENVLAANPMYENVIPGIPGSGLDFNLKAGSPAEGFASDGLNAGSVAAMPVSVYEWNLY